MRQNRKSRVGGELRAGVASGVLWDVAYASQLWHRRTASLASHSRYPASYPSRVLLRSALSSVGKSITRGEGEEGWHCTVVGLQLEETAPVSVLYSCLMVDLPTLPLYCRHAVENVEGKSKYAQCGMRGRKKIEARVGGARQHGTFINPGGQGLSFRHGGSATCS